MAKRASFLVSTRPPPVRAQRYRPTERSLRQSHRSRADLTRYGPVIAIPESHLDLVRQPHGCVITTVAPDGLLQSTAMWFLFEDDKIKFSLLGHRKKYRNLQANPACTCLLYTSPSPRD